MRDGDLSRGLDGLNDGATVGRRALAKGLNGAGGERGEGDEQPNDDSKVLFENNYSITTYMAVIRSGSPSVGTVSVGACRAGPKPSSVCG